MRRWLGALRPPRPTVRLRLTALYAALFGAAGAVLLVTAYLLVEGPVRRAVPDAAADAALSDLRVDLVVAGLAALVVAVVAGWWLAGRALEPLRRIAATAERMDDESLSRERIALEGPEDELRATAAALDRMLDRLDTAFDAQRRFVANASHELRTPLTVMRTEVDVALADPDATVEELRAMGDGVREAIGRADALVTSLLDLARSESGTTGSDEIDLGHAARVALHDVADEARARGLRAELEIGPAPVRGDRRLVERAVANLIENAVRHNTPSGAVVVRSGTVGRRATIVVENDGMRVHEDELAELVQPFRRGTRTRASPSPAPPSLDPVEGPPGAGLGLSIVDAVARAHGGDLGLRTRPQGGLVATLELPAADPAGGATSSGRSRPAAPPGRHRGAGRSHDRAGRAR